VLYEQYLLVFEVNAPSQVRSMAMIISQDRLFCFDWPLCVAWQVNRMLQSCLSYRCSIACQFSEDRRLFVLAAIQQIALLICLGPIVNVRIISCNRRWLRWAVAVVVSADVVQRWVEGS